MTESYAGFPLRYDCDPARLPEALASRYVPLGRTPATEAFIDAAVAEPASRWQLWLRSLLIRFASDYDANARLGMYPLHLLCDEQLRRLFGLGTAPSTGLGRVLDVGAGTGDVTRVLSAHARSVTTVEQSRGMARLLRRQGFVCHETDLTTEPPPEPPYDLVACLNVVDRTARPRSLLSTLRSALVPEGRLLLSTPIPYDPFYYSGARTLAAEESLPTPADTWEGSVERFVHEFLEPLGFEVQSVSRVPYLSGGDPHRSLYVLDDAVFVCTVNVAHSGEGTGAVNL